jgi:hypothetical protein
MMRMNRKSGLRWRAVIVVAGILYLLGCEENPVPEVTPEPPGLRLLTEAQYRNIIADVFGEHISVVGRFNPLFRTNGLRALGARSAEITPESMESFERLGHQIADQVFEPTNRRSFMSCTLSEGDRLAQTCAPEVFALFGELLFRRPVSDAEIAQLVAAAESANRISGGVYEGMEAVLARMLVSPEFLFVADRVDIAASGEVRLDPYTIASRLSFFLWNTTPDQRLLEAARTGALSDADAREEVVEWMLASPKLERGLRNFFDDMLHLDEFSSIEKDSIIYPLYNYVVAEHAKEQTLRTISHLLLDEEGDYRDLFTTRTTYMSPALARLYQVPATRPDGGWSLYEFDEGDQFAGLLSQVGFSALHSHAGRSSPTLRGKAVREILFCQSVPPPPAAVDFALFNDPDSEFRTARQRLTAHNTEPACAGCHKITDPIGLGLEYLDSAGMLRETEDGAEIIVAGEVDGVPFTDIPSLGEAVSQNPALPECLVQRVYSTAIMRAPERGDRAMLDYLTAEFAASGHQYKPLLREIATAPSFFSVRLPDSGSAVADSAESDSAVSGSKESDLAVSDPAESDSAGKQI